MNLTTDSIVSMRLSAQLLHRPARRSGKNNLDAGAQQGAQRIVARLGGVQAQDYDGARWSIGIRLPHAVEQEIEAAIASQRIIRTWALRGTLHLLAAADVHWLLALLAPIVVSGNQRRYGELELDEETFVRSGRLIRACLGDGHPRTRSEICAVLEREGISTNGQRAPYLLQRAALEGAICLGPNLGRESTYTVLPRPEGQVACGTPKEALAALAERYFTSHGPATIRDFAWWSGLPASVAREALESTTSLRSMKWGQTTMWAGNEQPSQSSLPLESAYLLPPFDGCLLDYKDRSAVLDPAFGRRVNAGGGTIKPVVMLDGRVAGIWKQRKTKDDIQVSIEPFRDIGKGERDAVESAARRYGLYLNTTVTLQWSTAS